MEAIPLYSLFIALGVAILASALFSSSETSMMALDRYRLRHLVRQGHPAAKRVEEMLNRPDLLIGLILLGNNLVNIIAATIATLIGMRLLGDLGVLLAPFVLVAVFLVFAEVMPKTVAALHPEGIAFFFSRILKGLMWLLFPAVFLLNRISNGLLALLGVDPKHAQSQSLTREELTSIVHEATHSSSKHFQQMLLNILELEDIRVEDIMVPRSEVIGIDINGDPQEELNRIANTRHSRFPVYEGGIDSLIGILNVRYMARLLRGSGKFDMDALRGVLRESVYVQEHTTVHAQLLNFQAKKKRFGVVTDEYGVVLGVITLGDILEEIVGKFSISHQDYDVDIKKMGEKSGEWLLDGSLSLRELQQELNWKLPSQEAKTLNGFILEHLEEIPCVGMSFRHGRHVIEVVQVSENAVKKARVKLIEESADYDKNTD
ncbi:MAG: HlyC/CorC family transporter [Candidatus Eutrophobiaceae bacterium]